MSGFSIKGNQNVYFFVRDTLEGVVADSGEVLSHLKATDAERASARAAALNANHDGLRWAEWREGAIVVATSAGMLAQKCIKELDGEDAEAAIVAALTAQSLLTCRVPDHCIDSKRYPLFMAREVMTGLIEQLKASRSAAP